MLKFIKHHMDTIDGIAIYPVISFLLFFGFFIAVLLWVRSMGPRYVADLASLPFSEPSPKPDTDERPL